MNSKFRKFKEACAWFGLILAASSLVVITYVKMKFIFDSGNDAVTLVSISLGAGLLAFVFGLISLPTWRGIVTLTLIAIIAYLVFFTRLYGLA